MMVEGLEELKKEYEKLKKKYNLPDFKGLNEDFDIEKCSEKETDFVLREIRKTIMDKAIAYLRFIEMLINPANAPMFFMALAKSFSIEDRKLLEKIYGKIGEFELDVIEIDNYYSEKDEAEFIKKIHKEWQKIKQDMKKIIEALRRNWNSKSGKKDKGYLG